MMMIPGTVFLASWHVYIRCDRHVAHAANDLDFETLLRYACVPKRYLTGPGLVLRCPGPDFTVQL